MRWLLAVMLAGCWAGYRDVKVVDELDRGTCPRSELKPGDSCEVGARDYSAGATIGMPRDHASDVGGTAWFRYPLFDTELDERRLKRGDTLYHSLAGGVGTHLRPMMLLAPELQRYVDPVINGGFDLGVIKKDSHIEGRGDGYVAAALDLYAPDIGPFRYTDTGVPGIRVGVRYTAYVNGWGSDTTFELGLIWRWGVPIDLYHHWTTQRIGD